MPFSITLANYQSQSIIQQWAGPAGDEIQHVPFAILLVKTLGGFYYEERGVRPQITVTSMQYLIFKNDIT